MQTEKDEAILETVRDAFRMTFAELGVEVMPNATVVALAMSSWR